MRKLMVLAATIALMLVAAPAFAQNDFQDTYIDDTHAQQYLDGDLVEQYLGNDFADEYVDVQYPTGNVFINSWR